MNKFLSIKLTYDTVDIYHTRKSIYNALSQHVKHFKGNFLDVGCGQMPYKPLLQPAIGKYIGLDLNNDYSIVKPDISWDGITIPLDNETVESAMAAEVFEHVPDLDILLSEAGRVLKTGGLLFFTIPFLWPLHDIPHDEYRYTPFSIERIFKRNGFEIIKIGSLGGWNASMAQMIGLWIKRSDLPSSIRKLFYVLLYPVIKLLLYTDKPNNNFDESSMTTGLYGLVQKVKK